MSSFHLFQCFSSRHSRQKGFTLLEAIVSIVIMASLGMSLFAWLNTLLSGFHHSQIATQEINVTQQGVEFIDSINIMSQPKGEIALATITVHWQSILLEEVQKGTAFPSGVGLYDIGLYLIDVELYRNESMVASFSTRKMGYKQTRTVIQ